MTDQMGSPHSVAEWGCKPKWTLNVQSIHWGYVGVMFTVLAEALTEKAMSQSVDRVDYL